MEGWQRERERESERESSDIQKKEKERGREIERMIERKSQRIKWCGKEIKRRKKGGHREGREEKLHRDNYSKIRKII